MRLIVDDSITRDTSAKVERQVSTSNVCQATLYALPGRRPFVNASYSALKSLPASLHFLSSQVLTSLSASPRLPRSHSDHALLALRFLFALPGTLFKHAYCQFWFAGSPTSLVACRRYRWNRRHDRQLCRGIQASGSCRHCRGQLHSSKCSNWPGGLPVGCPHTLC